MADGNLLRPRVPEVEDLLHFRSNVVEEIAHGFLSDDRCSNLGCFMLDFVVDGLVMMIDDMNVMMIFVVLIFYEKMKILNPFKCIQIDTTYIGISMYLIS